MSKLNKDEVRKLRETAARELLERPPKISVIGVSGVGKSSTINAMFKTNLKVSHTSACTKDFQAIRADLRIKEGDVRDEPVSLTVVDAPGLGEDIALDPQYLEQYKHNLPDSDIILWILSARNRAIALDQMYLEEFKGYKQKIIFGVNQVDLVHPMDWNKRINLPSKKMEKNIQEIVTDRAKKLNLILEKESKIIPYSAERGFNLERLFASLIEACSKERRWIFAGLKNFSYKDFYHVED